MYDEFGDKIKYIKQERYKYGTGLDSVYEYSFYTAKRLWTCFRVILSVKKAHELAKFNNLVYTK